MKRILVPVDFSPYSAKAQQIAVHLAQKTGAKILLVHCVYTPLEWRSLTVRQQEEHPEVLAYTVDAEIKFAALAKSPLFQAADPEFHVVHGTPYQQIIEVAARFKVDLIVMGTHGNEKSDRPFVGSHSQRVVRMAPCPVLSVKHDAAVSSWKNVVFAADFEDNPGMAFGRIFSLVEQLGSHVHLLFIITPARFRTTPQALESIAQFSRKFPNVSFSHHVFNHLDLQSGIVEFTKTMDMDWLAMATHDRSHAPNYQLGFTETVLFHATVPVLSLR